MALVQCDICETTGSLPVWFFRADEFGYGVEADGKLELSEIFAQDSEWAACLACKTDVLADNQTALIARRYASARLQYGNTLPIEQFDAMLEFLALITMTFLACRQKGYGRAFSALDMADATISVAFHGRH